MIQAITKYVKHYDICQKQNRKRGGEDDLTCYTLCQAKVQPFECPSIDTIDGFNYYNSQKKYLHLMMDHATKICFRFLIERYYF